MKVLNKLTGVACFLAMFSIAGCKKDSKTLPATVQTAQASASNPKMVLFPGAGWVLASHVHYIASGHYLVHANGHYLEVEKGTDRLIQDFGDFTRKPGNAIPGGISPAGNAMAQSFASSFNAAKSNTGAVASGLNWITYATWANTSGSINFFTTNWKVPNAPTAPATSPTGPYQLYIWDGLLDSQTLSNVLQPVLQYGTKSFSGGMFWSEVNCYLGAPTAKTLEFYAYGDAVPVGTGSIIQGSMNLLGTQGGSYIYTASGALVVNGVAQSLSNTLTVQEGVTKWGPGPKQQGSKNWDSVATVIPQLNTAAEVLEAYGANGGTPTYLTQYPSDNYDPMTAIQITTTSGSPTIQWSPVTQTSNFGQKTVVQPSGEVDLYFHSSAPPAISYPTPQVLPDGLPATISPTNTGGPILSYSISPALAANLDLTFNTSTGVISGTPQNAETGGNYTVTATNSNGTSQAVINISEVANVNFAVTNNSGESLTITFKNTVTLAQVSNESNAGSGLISPFVSIPPGTYNITISPAGMPVNCNMVLNTGQGTYNAPGTVFTGVAVNPMGATSLSVTTP